MAAENLPSEFDVVILGTGLAESIVAAACSRVGQRVLHVDRRSYYAGNWASFTFNSLLTWIQEYNNASHIEETAHDWSSLIEEGEETICLSSTDSAISNLQVFCYASQEEEAEEEEATQTAGASNTTEEESGGGSGCTTETTDAPTGNAQELSESPEKQITETPEQVVETEQEGPKGSQSIPSPSQSQSEPVRKKITYAQLLKEGRRFNIDLVSKLMYSRGPLVDLLIKSNVSRYAEFKNLTRILTYRDGRVEQVPCSRADVFASKQLSVVEKRMLMKFLTFSLDYQDQPQEYQAFAERPFSEFLRTQKLTDNLRHFLHHSIAMVTEDTPTEEGLASTRHFLRCLGRYGNTPFLFPLYGLGEIPQCFCRMSAVFGGIYCLRHSIQGLVIDKDNKCKAVIDSRGLRISCSHFVAEDGFVGEGQKTRATPTRSISRVVLITDGSVLPSESEQQVSLVSIPPVEPGGPVARLVELCSSTQTCIPGTYLVHLTCQSVGSAYQDLSPVVTRLFQTPESQDQEGRPSVLWCMYFNMADSSAVEGASYDLPSNVHVCSGPDASLGHQHPIALAESIFQKILPEEEFCPPAPNPEDIIYDGDNTSSPGGLEEEAERQGEGEREEQTEGEGEREEQKEGEGEREEQKEGEEGREEQKEGEGEREEQKEGEEGREEQKKGEEGREEQKKGEEGRELQEKDREEEREQETARDEEKEGGEESKGKGEDEQGEEIQEEPPVEE